jgi:hypothetical protein
MRHQPTGSLKVPSGLVLVQSEQVPNRERLAAPIWALEDLGHGEGFYSGLADCGLFREQQARSEQAIGIRLWPTSSSSKGAFSGSS